MIVEAMNIIAIAIAIVSVWTGYAAVGKRGLWDFPSGVRPYICGSSRAYVYLLVIVTTIWAMYHALLLADWLIATADIKDPIGMVRREAWMAWNIGIEAIITAFHIWAKKHRVARTKSGEPDLMLWGGDGPCA
jgi:hypothetical protein